MFNTQIKFTGSHANLIKKYSKSKQGEGQVPFIVKDVKNNNREIHIFEDAMECYLVAAVVGVIENKRVKKSGEGIVNIFHEKVAKCETQLSEICQIVNFINRQNITVEENVKKTFTSTKQENRELELIIEEYIRGGIEVIDSYFYECLTIGDVSNAVCQFNEDYLADM